MPTRCSFGRPQRRYETSVQTELSPARVRSLVRSSSGLLAPHQLGFESLLMDRVRKRTLTNRVQPDHEILRNVARPGAHRKEDTTTPAPKRWGGWTGVAARAPRSRHQTREPAASSATTSPALATAVKQLPPPRHVLGATAAGLASGSSSEEPSPAPRHPRTRRFRAAQTQPARLAFHPCCHWRRSRHHHEREVTFEDAPGSMSKCTALSSRASLCRIR